MPDITSIEDPSEFTTEEHEDHSPLHLVVATPPPAAPSTPTVTSGGPQKFSYTKNWGEVSNTLRKKLSRRLSVLKESDDTSGDDGTYRSDSSSLFSPTIHRSENACGFHNSSPDQILGEAGVTSVRSSRAAIWQKMAQSAADAARPPPPARAGRLRDPGDPQQRAGSPLVRLGSETPEKVEYKSLGAFISRSATPERAAHRLQQVQQGRGNQTQSPERVVSTPEKASPRPSRASLLNEEQMNAMVDMTQKIYGTLANGITNPTNEQPLEYRENQTIDSTEVGDTEQIISAYADDVEDDDGPCEACEIEARVLESEEDKLRSPLSTRAELSEDDSASLADETKAGDSSVGTPVGRHKHRACLRAHSDDYDDSSESSYSASSKPAITHFVEVTNIEDGKKRITYVDNGVKVSSILPRKGMKGSSRRKPSQPKPAIDIIEEEDEEKSSLTSIVNESQDQPLNSPKPVSKSVHDDFEVTKTDMHEGSANGAFEREKIYGTTASTIHELKNGEELRTDISRDSQNAQHEEIYGQTKATAAKHHPEKHENPVKAKPTASATKSTKVSNKHLKQNCRRRQTAAANREQQKPGTKRSAGQTGDSIYGSTTQQTAKPPASTRKQVVLDAPKDSHPNGEAADLTKPSVSQPDRGEAESAPSHVARRDTHRQALYESIPEVRASKRRSRTSHPATASVATSSVVYSASEVSAKRQQQLDRYEEEDEESEDSSSSYSSSSDTDGAERNYRLRRSALGALPIRVPQLRDLLESRFRSAEVTDPEEDTPITPQSDDPWRSSPLADSSETDSDSTNQSPPFEPGDNGKQPLLQFAMLRFRDADEKYNMLRDDDPARAVESKNKRNKGSKKHKEDWTWKEQLELVKWTNQPIKQSLLRLGSTELNRTAVECFTAILRYTGDQPMPRAVAAVDCVYTVLMACHRYSALRDEIYCQLMRQTTSNRSEAADSCGRAWRLLSLVAAYFVCSEALRPFLVGYLRTVAGDERRACHGTALVCLHNLRRTERFGGRKNVPSEQEVAAVTAGRTGRRQRLLLPGGTERIVSTRITTVVQDLIEELCRLLDVTDPDEREEFSIFCIVEGDSLPIPLSGDEYITDVTTELQKNKQTFHLMLCRSVHVSPLRLDAPLYVETVFSQTVPDYLEGLLLVMPDAMLQQRVVFDIARLAALLHRAADLQTMPTMKETKYLLPRAALLVRDVKPPQWVNMVQDSWSEARQKTPLQAKAAVLDTLSTWPLFGSSFFVVRRARAAPEERPPSDRLLAINARGIHLIDTVTHETLAWHPYREVLSTRRVRSEAGVQFLDIKYCSGQQARITRIQSASSSEIARLIRQYSRLQPRAAPADAGRRADSRERQLSR